jgi:phosphatidylglycerol:prolipoprotein diacylglycerol transferase
MQQVLFHIPGTDIPLYGFGTMLAIAFFACLWLAGRRARRAGVPSELIQDLAVWILIGGIVGARVTFMIQYGLPLWQFFKIWDGGIVFYGSALGGLAGYLLGYYLVLSKYKVSTGRVADIVAPCAALGLCLGRLGCFLNGCCYGNVACPDCPAVHFPMSSAPRQALVERGLQTAAGFTLTDSLPVARVGKVAPGSPAYTSGLRDGDEVLKADGHEVGQSVIVIEKEADRYVPHRYPDADRAREAAGQFRKAGHDVRVVDDLSFYLVNDWPRGKNDLQLTVRHAGGAVEELPPFAPRTLGLHPTQLYESVSMALLFFLLVAYYPFRRHDGSVMVLFMLGYSVHRFLNEMLRHDTDPVAFGLTLSQNGSVLVFVAGLALGLWLWSRPARGQSAEAAPRQAEERVASVP